MPVALYMDQHVPRAITTGLRLRGLDVITAHEDGNSETDDPELLDRATALERLFFTQDKGFLAEGVNRQRGGRHFYGVVYAHQQVSIGRCVEDLDILTGTEDLENLIGRVTFLPI
jgi:hypothetical protein